MQYSRHCCITNVAHGRSDANYFGKDACELRTIERMNCQSTTGAPDSSALSQTFAMHLRATSDPPYSVFMLLLRQIQVLIVFGAVVDVIQVTDRHTDTQTNWVNTGSTTPRGVFAEKEMVSVMPYWLTSLIHRL